MIDLDGRICGGCVGDPILQAWITTAGETGTCEGCESEAPSIAIEKLKWRIDEAFKSQFCPGAGPEAATIFARIAGISETLAELLADDLADTYGHLAERGKAVDPYDAEGFVEDGPDDLSDDYRWHDFQRTIRREARYFNNDAESWLDDIFTGLNDHRTWNGNSVIVDMAAETAGNGFFRARYAPNDAKLAEILSDPISQLGPPPNGTASAGRMNSAGISVFYGAIDRETCLSEIRAPVGSSVVIGRFNPIRPIRLLDLDRLSRVAYNGSHFDEDYWGKRNRVYILPAIVRQIARPIMPGDEAFGYLPTQFVADYLAQRLEPEIDGVLFASSQTNGTGQNVVLFNRACRVESLDPTLEFSLYNRSNEPAEMDDWLALTLSKRKTPKPLSPMVDWDDERRPFLRLDLSSIEVREIRATKYEAPPRRNYSFTER